MASRMVAPETPAPALSASSSANSWEVVASDDDDGADVEGRLGGEEDDTPPHESDTRERRTERTPSGSSDSSAGSAGASAAMRRLREAMVAEGTREEERTTSTPKKKKKREPAFARLERLRVRSSARRYRDLGLCERECAALAIATELVFSESSRGIASQTLDGVFSPRTVDAESAGSATCANDEPKKTPKKKKPPPRSMFSFSACFLLRRATRFETFAAFARLGKRLRESIASGSASSETCASAIENVESRTRKRRESFAPNRRSRGAGSGFRTERRLAGFRNRERVSVLRGVLAFAVVAALALAAAARARVGRSTWRVATSATAAAAAAARSAARVPPRLP